MRKSKLRIYHAEIPKAIEAERCSVYCIGLQSCGFDSLQMRHASVLQYRELFCFFSLRLPLQPVLCLVQNSEMGVRQFFDFATM